VDLVYDHALTHVCDQVKQAQKDINGSRLEQEELVVEFIDPCLTSIYQPPDIVVNGPLKKKIREEYHNHVFELSCNLEESLSLNAGDKIPVSPEDLVRFIENANDKINSTSRKIVGLRILSKHVVWIHGQMLQKRYLRRILKCFRILK
jgi:hypothetical protein